MTGGPGLVGAPLVDLLLDRGVSVTALTRSDSGARSLRQKGATSICGDLSSPASWQQVASGADVVFHTAVPRLVPPLRGRQIRRLERQAAEGARSLASALPPDAVVVMASCGLGDADGPLRIATPALAAERELSRTNLRVVRFPWAYGPSGFIRDLARGLHLRRVRIVGPGTNRIALIGARDAAAALHAAAAGPDGRYAVAEDQSPTLTELVHHMCAGQGVPRPDHLPPRMASLSMGSVVTEALVADQRVAGPGPRGYEPSQRWQTDLLDALLG